MASEGPEHSADRDHRYEGDDRVDDSDHDDVAIAFAVRQAADSKQAHNCAIMGQDVQGAGTDHGHAMQEAGIDTVPRGDVHVGPAKRVERDRQPP